MSEDVLAQLRAGKLMVRQKPGPKNALGLIKFIFPNSNNVYLHSTPSQSLFAMSRRDFSHGCIRVEDPAALAEWVLRNNPGWTRAKIDATFKVEKEQQVNLTNQIPGPDRLRHRGSLQKTATQNSFKISTASTKNWKS